MGLYRRKKSPYWWYTFKLKDQERVYGSTEVTDKKAAELIFQQVRLDHKNEKVHQKPSEITVPELLTEYLSKEPNPIIRARKKSNMQRLFVSFDGIKAKNLTSEKIDEVRIEWLRDGIQENSVNRYLRPLSAAWNRFKKKYNLPTNPFEDEEFEFYDEDQFRRHVDVPEESLQALFDALSPLTRAFVELDYYTGRRKGELINLKWIHLNLDAGTFQSYDNKQKSSVVYPLHNRAIEILKGLPRLGPWVFCYPDGSQLKSDGKVKTEFNRVKKRFGLDHVRFHDIRHIFATKLTEKTGDIYSTSWLLGHRDVKTTEIYINFKPTHLRAQLNKLNGFVSKPKDSKKVTPGMTAGKPVSVFSPN